MAITNIPDDLVSRDRITIDYVSEIIKKLKNCCPAKEHVVQSIKFFKDNWLSIVLLAVITLSILILFKIIMLMIDCVFKKFDKFDKNLQDDYYDDYSGKISWNIWYLNKLSEENI
jgi:hypothetical protein